jgi:hypothetical protein
MPIVRTIVASAVLLVFASLVAADDVIEVAPAFEGRVRAFKVARPLPAPAPDTKADDKKGEEKKEDKDKKEDETPAPPRPPAEPIDPEIIKLHLLDGSVVTGKLSVKEILVETTFGKLTIPVGNIISFRPGLDSFPEVAKQINDLITALAAADYNEREAAQKELIKMGAPIRKLLEARQKSDDDAERNRRIKIILEGFEEGGAGDEEEGAPQEWIPLDTIVTTDFTVVGRIVQKKFGVTSKFGELTVNLGDVRRGERGQSAKEDVRRSIAVDGAAIAQRSFKNTKIRVEVGDRVSITADGTITMTPWGSNAMSTPDGSPNYGWYMGNDVAAGALVAKIGDSGPIFKVGSKNTFVAKKAGTLMLAIGMNPSYANQAFPGKYDVKVRVQPK